MTQRKVGESILAYMLMLYEVGMIMVAICLGILYVELKTMQERLDVFETKLTDRGFYIV